MLNNKRDRNLKKNVKLEIQTQKPFEMVKHCCFSGCNSNSKRHDVKFITFVKPGTNLQRCRRWIHLCGRDSETFNYSKITKASEIYCVVRQ